MPEINIQDIISKARVDGVSSEDLDELVHEVVSKTASSINNGGLEAQIEFLVDELGSYEVEKEIEKLLGDIKNVAIQSS